MSMNKLRTLGASAALAVALAPQLASAVEISDAGAGSAVVIPYYTVNGGWQTLVNITNTTENTLALKFRMHEAQNSRDILDFNLVLSPFDVWTAYVQKDSNGRPHLYTGDRSCTSPLSVRDVGQAASEVAYTDFTGGTFRDFDGTRVSGSDAAISRMSEGYIAIITMGEDNRTDLFKTTTRAPTSSDAAVRMPTAYYAKHVNGEPRDCSIVDADFQPDHGEGSPMTLASLAEDNATILGEDGSGDPNARYSHSTGGLAENATTWYALADNNTRYGFGPVRSSSPLKVVATLVNEERGTAANVPPLNIVDFGNGENLVTAQEFPWFLEPSLSSTGGLWTMSDELGGIENLIAAQAIKGPWTSATGNGARAEWAVTLPTKRFHVDQDYHNIQAACNKYRNLIGPGFGAYTAGESGAAYSGYGVVPPADAPIRFADPDSSCGSSTNIDDGFARTGKVAFQDGNTGTAPIATTSKIYDREEQVASITTTSGTRPSPAPPGDPVPLSLLDYETNVFRIGRDVAGLNPILNSVRPVEVDVTTQGLPGTNRTGWMSLTFQNEDKATVLLPVGGFVITQRDFGNAGLNFSNGSELTYDRSAP